MLPILALLLALAPAASARAERHELRSPDGLTVVTVDLADAVRFSVTRRGRIVLEPSTIGLEIEGGPVLGRPPRTRRVSRSIAAQRLPVPVPVRRRTVVDRHRELTIDLRDGPSLVFRAWDDAVAYRLVTTRDGEIRVRNERADLRFPEGSVGWLPIVDCSRRPGQDCFHTSCEETYTILPLADLGSARRAFLPVLVAVPGGPKVVLTESDLDDYPGLWVTGSADGTASLHALFPGYPLEETVMGEAFPQAIVTKRAPYVAVTSGRRSFPWRVLAIAERDAQLAETDVVWRLGGETAPGDWSWIKGGKSQSEWLWDNILYDVPFRAGYNTETYRHYLSFADRFRTGYLFFDAGWSKVTDLFGLTPSIDVPGLVAEARAKGVGVVLWVSSLALSRQMGPALDRLRDWGVAGIMVDFMDRDDQPMVAFYRRVAEETAKRRLFVDFHGAFKPTGLERRFPNALTREGLVASEYHKWSDVLTPEYEVALPFIRGMAGPMDYEPGHMRNAQKEAFRVMGSQPMSQGTRVHQLAMYVVYESPWSKMGGNVSDYLREPEYTAFLASIPTLWEETHVLDGAVGDYVVTQRVAAGGEVWVGAMTDWTAREVPLDLAVLGEGRWTAEVYEDGPNADRYAADWRRETREVTAGERLTVRMAPGGGWVARFRRASASASVTDRATLERKRAAAEEARDWAAALDAARQLEEAAEGDHVEALFHVARLHALLGHRDEACEALERLGQAGLFDVSRVRKDEAFASLREDERFRKAVRAIWLRGYLWLLERPERDAYQRPDQVMAALAFRPGERVADIGAGSGYFTRRISPAVGPTGVVWAIDIAPEVLEYLEARARREELANIRVQRVRADDPQLPAGGVDTILMVDTLHYVKDRPAYAKKLRAALAPGGRVVVIDFVPKSPEERPWGPPPEQKMSREEVDAAMAEAGLAPARVHDFLTEQFFIEYRPR